MKRKKNNGKKWETMLLLITGAIVVLLTYIFCLLVSEDIRVYGTNFGTFCINTLILYTFLSIRWLKKHRNKRVIQKIDKFSDVEKDLELEKNTIPESVRFYLNQKGTDYIQFDAYDEGYRKGISAIVLFNLGICLLGTIPYFMVEKSFESRALLVSLICVGIFNIIFLLFGEMECNSIKFCSIPITNNIIEVERKINEKYDKIITCQIQKETVEYYGTSPYYLIQYTKGKKCYRIILSVLIMFGAISLLLYMYRNGGLYGLASKDNLILTLYPNIVLIAFCICSNQNYYSKIYHHQVSIEKFDKEVLLHQNSSEIKQLFCQVPGNKNKNDKYLITVDMITEFDWFMRGIKKFISSKKL